MADSDVDPSTVQEKIAVRVAEFGLKEPRLPFPTFCLDGIEYKDFDYKIKTFPLFKKDVERRLKRIGQFWNGENLGVLEFVDLEGQYHVTRDIPAIRDALKDANYIRIEDIPFLARGRYPSHEEDLDRIHSIFKTPQNEIERLQWSIRDNNIEEFRYALDHGVDLASAKSYGKSDEPIIFQALEGGKAVDPEIVGEMVACLSKKSPLVTNAGETVLHRAIHNSTYHHLPDYLLHVMPTLIKTGVDPFALYNNIPAFLEVQAGNSGACEKLALISAAMLETDRLSKKEKQIIKAQCQIIDDAITSGEEGEAKKIVDAFQVAWKQAQYFVVSAENEGKIPQNVFSLLEPLADSKRIPKFLESLLHGFQRLPNVHDLVEEFTTLVVLPQHIMDYHQRLGIPVTRESLHKLEKEFGTNPHDLGWQLVSHLTPLVKEELFKGRSLDKIIGLNEAWHSREVVFPDSLVPLKANGEWYPLTEEKIHPLPGDSGISIHVLTKDTELVREGRHMNHCVGGGNYTTKCLASESHILSVRTEEETLSTIEAKWDGKELKIVQNQAVGNGVPCQEALDAGQWFKKQMESGALTPSKVFGETEESKKRREQLNLPKIVERVGYDFTQVNINEAFCEYCHNTRRRAREYDPKTGKFDKVSRNTDLIQGSYSTFIGEEDNFLLLDEERKPIHKAFPYKNLPANVWYKASGLREKVWANSPLNALVEKELERRRVLSEQAAKQIEPVVAQTEQKGAQAERGAVGQVARAEADEHVGRIRSFFQSVAKILPFRKKVDAGGDTGKARRSRLPLTNVLHADDHGMAAVSNSDVQSGPTADEAEPKKGPQGIRSNRRKFRPFSR